MEKTMVGKTSVCARGAVIAGAIVNGKANYLTLGCFGNLSPRPAIVYISVNKTHYTNAGIRENGYYSVNLPTRELVQKTDYVGLVSGKDTDKSGVFTAFYGTINKAPMIQECPVNMLCKVINIVDLPTNEVFIGEVVETYVNKDCLTDDKPDIRKINPLILGGNAYWELGNKAGTTYTDGKALIKK